MERDLNERKNVGVSDAVLLETLNEDIFIENLRKRFEKGIIYVSKIRNRELKDLSRTQIYRPTLVTSSSV